MKRISSVVIAVFTLFQVNLLAQNSNTNAQNLDGFDEIAISGGFDHITLKQGSRESISITAKNGSDIDKVSAKVHNNTLSVGMKKGSYKSKNYSIVITFKKLKGISNSGSSDITSKSTIQGDKLEIASSGSGDMALKMDVSKLEIAISGSSDMVLSGSADKQEIAISGSGDVNASKLKGKSAEVAVSGSGDVTLNVSGKVESAVSGSGDISNNKG